MSQIITASVPFFGVGGSGLIQRPLNATPPAPTLDPLTAVDSATLFISFSRDEPFDNYEVELYLDEALTIFANGAGPANIGSSVGSFNTTIGSLLADTQYWGRARVSADSGVTYSGWSNIGTGTTNP